MDRRLVVAVVVAALAAGIVGRVTAQSGSYAGGMAMIGVAAIEGYSVDVDGDTATVRGTVRNVSNVPLANVTVTVWDNDSWYAPVGDLAPGQSAAFEVTVDAGPNWAWNANVTADVVRGVYGVAALPSAGR